MKKKNPIEKQIAEMFTKKWEKAKTKVDVCEDYCPLCGGELELHEERCSFDTTFDMNYDGCHWDCLACKTQGIVWHNSRSDMFHHHTIGNQEFKRRR